MSGKPVAKKAAASKGASSKALPPSKKARRDVDAGAKAAARAADEDDMSSGTESDDIDDDEDDSDDSSDDGIDMTREGQNGEDDEDEDEEDGDNTVNVEFNFMDPREIHYKSVRRLLEHYLPGEEETFNVSGLADAIIAQQAVGTMVTVNDDLDVYAFATVLPVALYKDADWMASIRKWVLAKARDAAAGGHLPFASVDRLTAAWEDPAGSGLGLLLNERLVNMPPELAPALHESLAADLAWATANAGAPGHREAFAGLKALLLLSPCFSERASQGEIAAHAAAVADAGANAAGRKAPGAKARKPRHEGKGAAAPTAEGEGAVAPTDPLGLGAGWITHFLHFEEELYATQAASAAATASSSAAASSASSSSASSSSAPAAPAASAPALSFSLRVAHFEKSDGPAPVKGDIGAPSAGSSEGKKGKGASSSSSSAAAVPQRELDAGGKTLRPPASRRISVVPSSAVPLCVEAMKHLLVEAQGAGAAAAAAAPAGAGASSSAAASKGRK